MKRGDEMAGALACGVWWFPFVGVALQVSRDR